MSMPSYPQQPNADQAQYGGQYGAPYGAPEPPAATVSRSRPSCWV